MGPKAQAMTDQTIIRSIWVFYWYHNFFFYWKQTAASVLPISFVEFIWYIYCFYWAGFSWYFQLKRSFWMYAKRFYTQILFWVDLVMFQFLNSPGFSNMFLFFLFWQHFVLPKCVLHSGATGAFGCRNTKTTIK